MGYKIRYDAFMPKAGTYKCNQRKKRIIKWIITGILVLGLLVPAYRKGFLKELLIPGDSVVTQQAIENMVANIKDGATIQDAIVAFCEEVIENEKLY